MSWEHVLLLAASYIVGAIPFGAIAARLMGSDLSKIGSGSVGATNVHRALGWKWSLPVFILDVAKGLVPAIAAHQIIRDDTVAWSFAAGLSAVVGHCLSVFLKFKGGKGVATGLGALLGSTPLVASGALLVFLVFMAAYRMVSLASLVACVALLPFDFMFQTPSIVMIGHGGLIVIIFYRHRANIGRIRRGEEPKFKL